MLMALQLNSFYCLEIKIFRGANLEVKVLKYILENILSPKFVTLKSVLENNDFFFLL